MDTQLDGANGLAGAGGGQGVSRRALAGLTPGVIAVVAALLFARALGANVGELLVASRSHRLSDWLVDLFVGFPNLLVMAAPMVVGVTATANLGPRQGLRRFAALAIAVVLSSLAGLALRAGFGWLRGGGSPPLHIVLAYLWPRYALLGGLFTIAAEFYRREVASIEAMQRAELEKASLEQEMAAARLQGLQAQIEPHFLFNTLANVRRLYGQSQEQGAVMLDNLMRYLEVALPRMRENTTTLERDAELVEAFLSVQRVRMGPRLAFSVDIPDALRKLPIPPMMLLTLVENAVKHGLNPSVEGGLIRVAARCESERLILSVADTGVGFSPGYGGGTGLANVRARLAAQFGNRADLALANNELGGVTATIVLPLTGGLPAK